MFMQTVHVGSRWFQGFYETSAKTLAWKLADFAEKYIPKAFANITIISHEQTVQDIKSKALLPPFLGQIVNGNVHLISDV